MYEPDPGVELCVPCQAFFEAGHADQYDANFTGIEYGAYLFKATYSETIRLINNDQRRRVRKPHVFDVVLLGYLLGCRMELRKRFD